MDIINPTNHTTTTFDGVNLAREKAAATAKPARPCYGLAALFVFVFIIAAAWACDKAAGVPV